MNKGYIKWFKGALLGTAVVTVVAACTDDHFDIDSTVSGRQTLWENIKGNSELSEFADLLDRVKYSQSETQPTDETYAQLFSSAQSFTVWAPQNGTFDYQKYDALLNTGNQADAYKVEQELIRNCMTRFSHVMSGTASTRLNLFNGKTALFDCKEAEMKGQKIVAPNIGATNGVLHIIDGAVEYQPNLYEFLSTRPELEFLTEFISKYTETKFDETLSTQGPTVDGMVTWVDSVFTTSNEYLTYTVNAHLTREDSTYAMVMPTNTAWNTALAMTEKYYKYKDVYEQDVATVTAEGNDTIITGVETTFTLEELDSIMEFRSKNAIVQNLVFNANTQWGKNYEDFSVEGACDSLESTTGVVFEDPFSARLFDGAAPIETSNGYAYIVDNFNYLPDQSWADEIVVEAERNVETADSKTIGLSTTFNITLTDTTHVLQDSIAKYSAYVISPRGSASTPSATFILRDLLSCKYDIYVLIAFNDQYRKPNKFSATLSYHIQGTKTKHQQAKLDNPDGVNGRNFINREPKIENGKWEYVVDTVCLARDFEFPVCYEGLENAYATIAIANTAKNTETNVYAKEIRIDKFILKAKDF